MTQYNTWNLKLSDLSLSKLKLGIKNDTLLTLKISSNALGDSNNKNNSLHKLLVTNTQTSKLCKAFANGS